MRAGRAADRRPWTPSSRSTSATRTTTCSSPRACRSRAGRERISWRGMAESAPSASAAPLELRARYNEAFRAWLAHRDERELGTAYALGREAVTRPAERARPRRGAPRGRAGGAARGGGPGAPRGAARGGGRVLRRGALDLRDRPPRLPRRAGGRAARARARQPAQRARAGVGEDQRDDDDRGGAAAHGRGGARGPRRAPRDDLEHRRRSRSRAASAPPRRAAGRPATRSARRSA